MRFLLLALPVAAFIALWATLLGAAAQKGRADWRDSFLRSCVAWGTLVAMSSEVLSLSHGLTRAWLASFWALTALGLLVFGLRKGLLHSTGAYVRSIRPGLSAGEKLILLGTAVIVLLLLLVAWVSPPNNVDSLLYHMARVAHWVQAASLDHFPSGYELQLMAPTWAETAVMHLRVLYGHDRPANLVQWFCMVACLIGVSEIARLLGAKRHAQLLASTLALSIPMGILQATSTQNDFAVAIWAVCLAYFVLKCRSVGNSREDLAYVGLSAGLGMLTKATGYMYVFPFLLLFIWPRRPWKLATWARGAAVVGLLIGVLNAGYWVRNLITFGGPFGTSQMMAYFLAPAASIGPAPPATPASDGQTAGAPASTAEAEGRGARTRQAQILERVIGIAIDVPNRLLQATAYQLATPFAGFTRRYVTALEAFPGVFPSELTHSVRRLRWNHEDFATSPVHMVLAGTAIVGVWSLRPRARWHGLCAYAAAIAFAYVLVAVVLTYGSSVWGIRFMLPFFVLSSPLVAAAVANLASCRVVLVGASCLVALSLPSTLLNNTRPLLTDLPNTTQVESILVADRTELLLANLQPEQDAYWNAAVEVETMRCRKLGLRLPSAYFPEYPFWWLLDAPESGTRIESLFHSTHTERYLDPLFKPCAIVCSDCAAGDEIPGYSLAARYGPFSVLRPILTDE